MNQSINVLLVEDEFITLDDLKSTLKEIGYGIAGDAMSAEEAIAILEKKQTDIAIIDIHLKGSKSGIWIANQINQHYKIPFIFLTAYSDKQTVGLAAETQPAGYLVKPFSAPDLFTAIEIALKNYARIHHPRPPINADDVILNDFIFIKGSAAYHKICIADIQFLEVFKNYLELHLTDKKIIIRSTLKDFLENLPTEFFLQPHRSFVVNKKYIQVVKGNTVWINDQDVPISRRFREGFMEGLDL